MNETKFCDSCGINKDLPHTLHQSQLGEKFWREHAKSFEADLKATKSVLDGMTERAETAERLLQEREGNSISDEMLNFLHGCGPLEGFHFGEIPPTERGQFWWRKRLPRPKDTP